MRRTADLPAVWLDGKRGLSRNGFEAARYAADRAAQHWGAAFAHQVQTYGVQVWLAGLQLSASSRQKIAQALKGAFQIGIE